MQIYDFQKEGVKFLTNNRRALLADSMGLGKSVQAIYAAKDLMLDKILIICPASVKYVWKNELLKWLPDLHHLYIRVVEGKKEARPLAVGFTIINYDLLATKSVLLPLISQKYDLLICDEAHYLKNFKAKRTKCVYYPKGIASCADRVWLLTGTPVLNRPVELFSHLKALVPELLGPYKSFVHYAKHFCGAYEGKWGLDTSGATNLGELSEILSSFMLRREKKDVLKDLPDKTYQNIYIPKTKEIESLAKKERVEYENSKESVLGELASVRRKSGIAKVPGVLDYVRDVLEEKEKVVLFAYHRDVIRELKEGLKSYSPVTLTGETPSRSRQEAVDIFKNDAKCRVFIGQIEAAGTGINGLQEVCDTVIFAEITWVPGQIEQAADRCHRIGQKNPVLIQFLIVENSIDEDILESLDRKRGVIAEVVKASPVEKQKEEREELMSHIVTVRLTVSEEHDPLAAISSIRAIAEEFKGSLKEFSSAFIPTIPGVTGPAVTASVLAAAKPAPEKEKEKPAGKVAKKKEAAAATSGEAVADFGSGAVAAPAEEKAMTSGELLQYCNKEIGKLISQADRVDAVKKVVAAFKKAFGVVSINQVKQEDIPAAKTLFDNAMGI